MKNKTTAKKKKINEYVKCTATTDIFPKMTIEKNKKI